MAVIALIPTGSMEHLALAPALHRIFPDHKFVVRPAERHLEGFTSCDVTLLRTETSTIPTALEELAATLVNAIFPGRRNEQIDFAFVVEDLELCNQQYPEKVIELFRNAVNSYIASQWPQQSAPRFEDVRPRCSFHLFRPMPEAYFFGDPQALIKARAHSPPCLPDDCDLELFRTIDQTYLNLPLQSDHIVDPPLREQHPKSYLQYLCNPTLMKRGSWYRETKNGRDALLSLDWECVLKHPSRCPFLTAFLDDLSFALNCPLPFVNHEYADSRVRAFNACDRILRNL